MAGTGKNVRGCRIADVLDVRVVFGNHALCAAAAVRRITLDALTVGRRDRIIQAIMLGRSLSAARRARAVLGQICGYAVRDDAIPFNVRDVQRLPLPEKKTSILTPEQIAGIRELMQQWRVRPGNGQRPDYQALIDGMDIILGTSARVGECIGLRRCDVNMTVSTPTVLIGGTIVQTKEQGIYRKNSPKRTRQRRRLALARRGKQALLSATKNGNPISVSNYERLLRSFIDDNRQALEGLGADSAPPLGSRFGCGRANFFLCAS